MTIPAQLKAETIAAAIYAATGIQPQVIYRPDRNPFVTFSNENAEKMRAFVYTQMKKKGDVDIDFLRLVKPVILKDLLPYVLLAFLGAFGAGYFTGQMH